MDNNIMDSAREFAIKFFKEHESIDIDRLEGQINIVDVIIQEIIKNGEKTFIVEVPTGGGKSILGFVLIEFFKGILKIVNGKKVLSTRFEIDTNSKSDLTNCYNEGGDCNTAFMLTPNRLLQRQYENDLQRFKFDGHVSLEGQANYRCEAADVNFVSRKCKKVAFGKLSEHPEFSSCSRTCEYLIRRSKVVKGVNAVLNYSLFITIMDKVYKNLGEYSPIQPRTLMFADEAHTLRNTLQNQFTISSDLAMYAYKVVKNFNAAIGIVFHNNFMNDNKFPAEYTDTINKFQGVVTQHYNNLIWYGECEEAHWITTMAENARTELLSLIDNMTKVARIKNYILGFLPENVHDYTNSDRSVVKLLEEFDNLYNSLSGMRDIYSNNPMATVLDVEINKSNRKQVRIRTADELNLVQQKFMAYTDYTVMTSATFGDIDMFAKSHGIEKYVPIRVESTFGFEKSPIHFLQPMAKMTNAHKDESIDIVLQNIERIISMPKFKNENGIIHTGSYALSKLLETYISRTAHAWRFVKCSNATEKQKAIERTKHERGIILYGPGLLEGLDLKGEQCRFSIHMKVPYPYLGDKLVARKQKLDRDWYSYETLNNIIQSFGRPIREKGDYAEIFCVDGDFEAFFVRYGHDRLPQKELVDRFKKVEWYKDGFYSYDERIAIKKRELYEANNPNAVKETKQPEVVTDNYAQQPQQNDSEAPEELDLASLMDF